MAEEKELEKVIKAIKEADTLEKKEIEVSINKNKEDNDRILENIANNISTLEELIFRASRDQVTITME